jgi:hypothetical protein
MGLVYSCISGGVAAISIVRCGYENVPLAATVPQKTKMFISGMINPGIPYGILSALLWPAFVGFGLFLGLLSIIWPK